MPLKHISRLALNMNSTICAEAWDCTIAVGTITHIFCIIILQGFVNFLAVLIPQRWGLCSCRTLYTHQDIVRLVIQKK